MSERARLRGLAATAAAILLVCVAALLSGDAPSAAASAADPSAQIRQLAQRAAALEEAGRLVDAEATILQALELQKSARAAPANLAMLRYFLASIYVDEARFGEAEPILKDVIQEIEKQSGAGSAGIVSPLAKLAETG